MEAKHSGSWQQCAAAGGWELGTLGTSCGPLNVGGCPSRSSCMQARVGYCVSTGGGERAQGGGGAGSGLVFTAWLPQSMHQLRHSERGRTSCCGQLHAGQAPGPAGVGGQGRAVGRGCAVWVHHRPGCRWRRVGAVQGGCWLAVSCQCGGPGAGARGCTRAIGATPAMGSTAAATTGCWPVIGMLLQRSDCSAQAGATVVMSWMLARRLSFLCWELRRMKYFCAWLATWEQGQSRG